MYRGFRVIGIVPAYNEQAKISNVATRTPREVVNKLLVVDNGSTDGTAAAARAAGAEVLSFPAVRSIARQIRAGLAAAQFRGVRRRRDHGRKRSGQPGGDSPVARPYRCGDSTWSWARGSWRAGIMGAIPRYRKIATRLHPWLVGWFVGEHVSESTNRLPRHPLEVPRQRADPA